jgi:hypothetical protein
MIIKCAECGLAADTSAQFGYPDWYVAAVARAGQVGDLSGALFYCSLKCVLSKAGRELPSRGAA